MVAECRCRSGLRHSWSHIITGAATGGVDEEVVPEPYRSAGIDVLHDRELITATGHGYRPSNCPLSLDLVRPDLGDLRRARLAETQFSGSSPLIWSVVAILSAVSHSIWSVGGKNLLRQLGVKRTGSG
jgi:hypothetical protein